MNQRIPDANARLDNDRRRMVRFGIIDRRDFSERRMEKIMSKNTPAQRAARKISDEYKNLKTYKNYDDGFETEHYLTEESTALIAAIIEAEYSQMPRAVKELYDAVKSVERKIDVGRALTDEEYERIVFALEATAVVLAKWRKECESNG